MNDCLHKQTAPKGFRTSVPRGRRRRKQEKLDGNVQLLCRLCRDFAAVTSFLTLVLLLKMIIVHVLCNAFIELQYAFHTSALTLYLHIPNFSTLYSLLLSALTTPRCLELTHIVCRRLKSSGKNFQPSFFRFYTFQLWFTFFLTFYALSQTFHFPSSVPDVCQHQDLV